MCFLSVYVSSNSSKNKYVVVGCFAWGVSTIVRRLRWRNHWRGIYPQAIPVAQGKAMDGNSRLINLACTVFGNTSACTPQRLSAFVKM